MKLCLVVCHTIIIQKDNTRNMLANSVMYLNISLKNK